MIKQNRSLTRDAALISMMSALIAVSSMISIPFTIPLTLQTFGVFFALFLLGGRRATVAIAVYVALGAVGIPVFSGFTGGVARLFDAGGGFIFGFIFAGIAYAVITWTVKIKSVQLIAAAVALFVIYFFGAGYYGIVYLSGTESVFTVLKIAVLPFILPDILKILFAYSISKRILRHHTP